MEQPPIEPTRCRCCGITCEPTQTLGGLIPSCIRCAGHWAVAVRCGGVHGLQLEREARALVRVRTWSPWYAIAVLAVDDAHLTNRLLMDFGAGRTPPIRVRVDDPPRRWEVEVCRALARGEIPSVEDVVPAVLSPFFGLDNTPDVRERIASELREAITAVVGQVVELDISVLPDAEHVGGFVANIVARVPADGEELVVAKAPDQPSAEERAVDQLARVLPFKGRAEA